MKQCSKCLVSKKSSEFYARKSKARKGELYNHCKTCLRERGKQYYQANRTRQLNLANDRRRKYRIERRKIINALKDKACTDCGQRYPHYVMDFDHKEMTSKRGNISHLVNRNFITIQALINEISKCDIVCANCHRIRTFTRKKVKIS